MARETHVNLYIGNHGKQDGIEDYITLITKLMQARGLPVTVSSTYDPDAVNLVIDEFTNYIENRRLAAFKSAHPRSRVVFVLTEFVARRWGAVSFNHFGGPFEAAAIALFDVYLRRVRDDFGRLTSGKLLKLLFYSPLFIAELVPDTLRLIAKLLLGKGWSKDGLGYLRRHHRTIYFHMRYLGFRACLPYADALITSHENIMSGVLLEACPEQRVAPSLGVLYPELDERDVLDKLMVGKKLFMEITGSVTRYRQKWIERTNRWLVSLGLQSVFGHCVSLPFSLLASSKPTERGAYSLHPPQTRRWPYSSPTRIFRALSVDHNLPILTDHYHQNPIEDVCFVLKDKTSVVELYEMYVDRNLLRRFIEPRVKSYNETVSSRNDTLVARLREIADRSGFEQVAQESQTNVHLFDGSVASASGQ
jgi:hypothetical protein